MNELRSISFVLVNIGKYYLIVLLLGSLMKFLRGPDTIL